MPGLSTRTADAAEELLRAARQADEVAELLDAALDAIHRTACRYPDGSGYFLDDDTLARCREAVARTRACLDRVARRLGQPLT
jgi:hypothetical protein